jgi:hypothetical protein
MCSETSSQSYGIQHYGHYVSRMLRLSVVYSCFYNDRDNFRIMSAHLMQYKDAWPSAPLLANSPALRAVLTHLGYLAILPLGLMRHCAPIYLSHKASAIPVYLDT